MLTFTWIASLLLIILGTYISCLNGYIFFIGVVHRRKAASWIPLLGGASGAVGLVLLPIPSVSRFWWVALLFDMGTAMGLGYTLIFCGLRILRKDGG